MSKYDALLAELDALNNIGKRPPTFDERETIVAAWNAIKTLERRREELRAALELYFREPKRFHKAASDALANAHRTAIEAEGYPGIAHDHNLALKHRDELIDSIARLLDGIYAHHATTNADTDALYQLAQREAAALDRVRAEGGVS